MNIFFKFRAFKTTFYIQGNVFGTKKIQRICLHLCLQTEPLILIIWHLTCMFFAMLWLHLF